MASLSVKKVDEKTVTAPERLGDLAVRLFSPAYAEGAWVLPKRNTSGPMEFSE